MSRQTWPRKAWTPCCAIDAGGVGVGVKEGGCADMDPTSSEPTKVHQRTPQEVTPHSEQVGIYAEDTGDNGQQNRTAAGRALCSSLLRTQSGDSARVVEVKLGHGLCRALDYALGTRRRR